MRMKIDFYDCEGFVIVRVPSLICVSHMSYEIMWQSHLRHDQLMSVCPRRRGPIK